MIIGIDEVGRGSWAGPLCVAAVAWPDGVRLKGLADSKVVLPANRVKLAAKIRTKAVGIGIGWVPAPIIDKLGMTAALKLAATNAFVQLQLPAENIIIDGRDKMLGDIPAQYIIKADGKIPAVMAASIVAKVARDTYMHRIHQQFADYQFIKHVGYGTKLHRQLIAQFGPCVQHRLSYAPLRQYAK
jgi:ribonuclease HII